MTWDLKRRALAPMLLIGMGLLSAGCRGPGVTVTHPTVTLPGGSGLAADVILPKVVPSKGLPVVLIQTRYWRSFRLRGGGGKNRIPQGPREPIVSKLVEAGFGVVVTDVRGTGASDGAWRWPWSAEEVGDMGPVIDWIVAQPWSNGVVGATGVSYEGTTALLSAAARRPALKAVLARQLEWELVDETIAPGGVRNVAFVDTWSRAVDALDRGAYPDMFPWYAKWFVSGVQRRDDDRDGRSLAALQRARVPATVSRRVSAVRSGSDPFGADGPPTDSLGPVGHAKALQATQAVVGLWGSWWDGATADAVLRAQSAMPIREAVIGPWDHEGTGNASPLRRRSSQRPTVALDSVVAFFTRHLLAPAGSTTPTVRWYVAGAESWRSADRWPSAKARTWTVVRERSANRLVEDVPDASSANGQQSGATDTLSVDFGASSGINNRWTSGLARPVDAPDRARARGVLSWRTASFGGGLSVFGAGDFACRVVLDAPEAALHVYLESVDTRGVVRVLTEGTRRVVATPGLVSEVTVRIRPVAFELPTGWALRVSVAGADHPTFERVPAIGAQRLRLSDCHLTLPTLPLPYAP
jgi:putative CocE/NonD family hydrolase